MVNVSMAADDMIEAVELIEQAAERLRWLVNSHEVPQRDWLAAVEIWQEVADSASKRLAVAVDCSRSSGASWSQIGNALGVTRQAAQQRYGAQS